jgi:hypothetical protein
VASYHPAPRRKIHRFAPDWPGIGGSEIPANDLDMQVLATGGEKANGTVLGQQMKIVATNATGIVRKKHQPWGPRRAPERNHRRTTETFERVKVPFCRSHADLSANLIEGSASTHMLAECLLS